MTTMAVQLLGLRVTGAFVLVLGLGVTAISVWSFAQTEVMAEALAIVAKAENRSFDPENWAQRWRIACSLAALTGAAGLIGGALALYKRPAGLLLTSGVVAIMAILPWLLEWLGVAQYQFEKGNPLETAILISLALMFGAGYQYSRRRVTSG